MNSEENHQVTPETTHGTDNSSLPGFVNCNITEANIVQFDSQSVEKDPVNQDSANEVLITAAAENINTNCTTNNQEIEANLNDANVQIEVNKEVANAAIPKIIEDYNSNSTDLNNHDEQHLSPSQSQTTTNECDNVVQHTKQTDVNSINVDLDNQDALVSNDNNKSAEISESVEQPKEHLPEKNAASAGPPVPKRKIPDLPEDLTNLKARCPTMSQEVLQLLHQKVKEDLAKVKETKNFVRAQGLRELSWKVTDLLALGSNIVKEIENKSAYQLSREHNAKKYRKKSKQWKQPQYEDNNTGNIEQNKSNVSQLSNRGRKNRQRRGFGNRNDCDRNQSLRQSKNRFDAKAAKRFADSIVNDILKNSIEQLMEERRSKEVPKQPNHTVNMAVSIVDTIISQSLATILTESTLIKNNLSLTEAELLSDMCEEGMLDQDSFLMDVTEVISIKTEPNFGG